MDIYYKKARWKQFLFIFAVLIGIGSLLFTNRLVNAISKEERTKIEHWARATQLLAVEDNLDEDIYNLLLLIIQNNKTIPVIIVENDEVMVDGNIKYSSKNREKVLRRELEKMKARQQPIVIPMPDKREQYLYYKESSLQSKLKVYPILQFGVIVLFIVIAYIAFSIARKSEQNLVWVGMAKETAHQLGTPLSSLMAWIEILKEQNIDENIITELKKDSERLEKITERFSKIGSQPELFPENLYMQLLTVIAYLKTRVSKRIDIVYNFDKQDECYVPLSSALFSWVIENLIRNSVDALEDKKGTISFHVEEKNDDVFIDIKDNGKGISKSKQKAIFNPGFTTKKRGWGLGLSLSKRIIENYHKGRIFLKSSEPEKETTIRIILPKK